MSDILRNITQGWAALVTTLQGKRQRARSVEGRRVAQLTGQALGHQWWSAVV